jgi:Asp/Glu/hydantoin racemase
MIKRFDQRTYNFKVEFSFFTSPTPGVPSINSPADAAKSAEVCLPHILPLVPHHDAFLVACYSQHPLVGMLRSDFGKLAGATTSGGHGARKYVNGIFEASVTTSLSLISESQRFGIVSTGWVWEDALTQAVHDFVGTGERGSDKYAGCETTGLNATELHDLPPDEVRGKMISATKRLLQRGWNGKTSDVQAICLGCAGMVGLDEAVRQACIEVLGDEGGKRLSIVDGVKAGVGSLVGLAVGDF